MFCFNMHEGVNKQVYSILSKEMEMGTPPPQKKTTTFNFSAIPQIYKVRRITDWYNNEANLFS